MRVQTVINLFKKHPSHIAVKKLRQKGAEELGSGIGRTCYSIPGTRKVVKVDDGGRYQTQNEIRTIKAIRTRKKLAHLRRYVPKLFYADPRRGVIIMERLDTSDMRKINRKLTELCDRLDRVPFGGNMTSDIHNENVGLTKTGQMKIFDLGFVEL